MGKIIHIFFMYNIIQLNNKELSELQEIAAEMGLKGIKSLERQDLIYSILDEQAIAGSQKKAAAEEAEKDAKALEMYIEKFQKKKERKAE